MNLIDMLPSFYHNSDFVKAYMSSQSVEHSFIKESIEDLVNNLYVNTATWGLDYFEEKLGLQTDKSKSYEERRERIKAKKIGTGTTTVKMIKDTALAFECGEVEITEIYNDYMFKLKFVSQKGMPKNIEDFKDAIDEIKPAHLAYILEFMFNTHKDLSVFTHSELSKYTHEELRISENLRGDEDISVPSYGNIVVSTNVINIEEGNSTSFTVCLDKAPIDNQIVSISKNNNDVILDKTSLTFTSSDYNIPQTININVLEDEDYSDETCVITLSSKDVLSKTIVVNITDNDSESVNIPVQSISLNKNTLTLKPNESEKLIATIYPSDATNQNMTWKSSNASVAGVSYNGMVSAYNEGNATITVTTEDGNKIATCDVTVSNSDNEEIIPPPALDNGIILNSTNHTINMGEMLTLSATINIDSSYAVFELRQNGTYLVSAYRDDSNIICYTGGLNAGTYSNLTAVAKAMENSVYVDIAESQPFTLTVNSNSSSDGGGSEGGGDSGGTNVYLEPSSLVFDSGTQYESKYFNVIGVSESDNVTFETNNNLVCSVRKLAYNRCEVIALANGSTNVSATFGSNKLDCYVSISNMGSDSTVEEPISLPERIDTVAWYNQTFYISYSTNKEASLHYLDKNDGNGYVRIYPSNSYTNYSLQVDPITTTEPTHTWKLKVTDSRGNEAVSTVLITMMGLPTDGGGGSETTPPSNDDYATRVLSLMYPMPQSHECVPSGAPSDWKYQSRWENKDKPTGWSAFGGWAQIYRVDGTPFTQNTGVEMKNYKVFGWKNGQWHSVVELPYVTGNFYAEDFTDDANTYFSNGIKPSDDRSSVIIRLTSDMTVSTSQGTKNVCYHPFTAQLDYDPEFEYIFTCVSMRKVKWDANGVDDMSTSRYCASCGGDWWRQKGLTWAPDWSNNKGIAQPKITEITTDWKVFAMTTVPQGWSNGFPK